MDSEIWDVIVVGGGPAGLSAALMLGRARRRVLVIDAGSPRNRFAAHMHGVLGHDGLDPAELTARGRAEVAAYGVEVTPGSVEGVTATPQGVRVVMADGAAHGARALVVATGITDELPDVPGLGERWGTSVLHCPFCHGWEVRDRRLGVLLTSPLGLHQAELVRQWSDRVTVFTAGVDVEPAVQQRLRARGVELVDVPVVEVLGEGDQVTAVRTTDGETPVDALFTAGAPRPHDAFLAGLGLTRAEGPMGSLLEVDATGRTSNERVWAVGNVVDPRANVPMVMGAGATTGGFITAVLGAEEFDEAVAAAVPADAPHDHAPHDHAPDVVPATFWEERYAGSDRVWSGRPNHTLVEVVGALPPGRALDLGCGEGADAIWLATQGWDATGLDISPTAVRRATDAAEAAGLPPERIRFLAADLDGSVEAEGYDLVTASFLHSPVALSRAEVLRRGAARVVPGGHLLVVGHAAAPPWSQADGHEHRFLTPQEEVDTLGLDPGEWTTVVAETRTRPATGPDGEEATLEDTVVLLRRERDGAAPA